MYTIVQIPFPFDGISYRGDFHRMLWTYAWRIYQTIKPFPPRQHDHCCIFHAVHHQHRDIECIFVSAQITLNELRSDCYFRALVSVAFHQIVRSISPVFTVIVYKLWFGREYSRATWISCIPITVGVSMVAYGELDFTAIGFALTLLGVVLAVTKSVVTNRLMTGSLALPPLEILLRISPLAAFQSLVYAMVTGEGAGFKKFVDDGQLTTGWVIALICNSCIAFVLNISSFQTNKVTGALTITVCGNLKQILTVLLGILIFNVKIGAINGMGMVVAIVGGAYYSKVELNNKQAKKAPSPAS